MSHVSHTCRAMPGYSEDAGKTIIRMKKQDMEKLGIDDGDIIRISANAATAAICLGIDAGHLEPDGTSLEHLNKFEKDYPIVRPSNVILSNAKVVGMGSLVEITRLGSKGETTKALKITLSTTKEAKATYGEDYEKRIDFTGHFGNIISRGDTITVPLSGSDRWSNFFGTVLDAEPSNSQHTWMVGDDTKFELRERADMRSHALPSDVLSRLTDLSRVVPIVKKVQITDELQLTVPFLEMYENGSKIFFYLIERIHRIETLNVDGHEMRRPVQTIDGLPLVNMKISDDRGNVYSCMRADGFGSGASFPSSSPDWEFFSRNTVSYAFWPPIGKEVRELKILVREFFWQRLPMPHHFPQPSPQRPFGRETKEKIGVRESSHVMTPVRPLGVSVLSGPWEFKVSLI